MTSNTTRLLSCSALTALLVPVAASTAWGAGLPDPSVTGDGANRSITVHAHRISGSFIPAGGSPTATFPTAAPRAGDAFTFVDDLSQQGTKVGTDTGRCAMKGAGAATCEATLTFAHGSLKSSGVSPQSAGAYSVPITHGTGSYSGATGQANVVPDATARNQYTDSDVTLTFAMPGAASSAAPSAPAVGSSFPANAGVAAAPPAGAGTMAAPASPHTGDSQVTTVPKGGAATGTGSTAQVDVGWLLLLGTAGLVTSGGVLLSARRSRRLGA